MNQRGVEILAAEEGFRARPYLCSGGYCTIGEGTNLEAHREYIPSHLRASTDGLTGQALVDALTAHMEWTRECARAALILEVRELEAQIAKRWPWSVEMSEPRRFVLVSMAYQMGLVRLAKFRKALSAMEVRMWNTVLREMHDSEWAREDSPARAQRMAAIMYVGAWPEA